MTYFKMADLDLSGKRVFIREDLNVPMKGETITSDARIRAAIPTIRRALDNNAAVIIVSHLGRPKPGKYEKEFSMAPIAKRLSELLGQEIPLVKDWLDLDTNDIQPGQAILGENVRFLVGEKDDDEALSKKMAGLCDVYVNDAFATSHRKEASTYGIAKYAPIACAGLLLEAELHALGKIMENPTRPLVGVIGGAKVSTKLKLLGSLTQVVDQLIVGGGIANTFIAAAGHPVGKSLYEPDLVENAKQLIAMAETLGAAIPLPEDVIVAKEFSVNAEAAVKNINEVAADEMILDIGPKTRVKFAEVIQSSKTIIWNGPLGAFEIDQFGEGTQALTEAIANSSAYSVAGGGDTIAAIEKYHVEDKISYISTGGGAFLEYLEGDKLPAVEALEESYAKKEIK